MSVTQTLFSEKREKTKNSTNPDNICKQKILPQVQLKMDNPEKLVT
jgi:hypothetical protein